MITSEKAAYHSISSAAVPERERTARPCRITRRTGAGGVAAVPPGSARASSSALVMSESTLAGAASRWDANSFTEPSV